MSWRALFGALSPAGPRARLSTLIFHRVLPAPDPLFPDEMDAARFDALCARVARWFNVLPLAQAVQRLQQGTLPARAMAITFDDGYADNEAVAVPILRRHRLHATFFVATGYLDGGRMWNDTLIETLRRAPGPQLALDFAPGLRAHPAAAGDPATATGTATALQALAALHPLHLGAADDWPARRAALQRLLPLVKYLPPALRQTLVDSLAAQQRVPLPTDLMMSSPQLQALRNAGMGVGAHTVSHPILCRLPDAQAQQELARSKAVLQALLQQPVALFAYPNGKRGQDYDARHAAMAQACGFAAAVSTEWGSAHRGSPLYELPRFTPWDRAPWRFAARLAGNLRH